jgi:hypothetical protein
VAVVEHGRYVAFQLLCIILKAKPNR